MEEAGKTGAEVWGAADVRLSMRLGTVEGVDGSGLRELAERGLGSAGSKGSD